MTDNKNFWTMQMAFLSAVYAFALATLLSGNSSHIVVLISALLLAAHALEIPLAFYMLRGRSASAPRVIVMCLLFGLIWWVPARRGLFKLN